MKKREKGKGFIIFIIILLIIIVLIPLLVIFGALDYVSVFNSQDDTPNSCVVNAPLSCTEYSISSSGLGFKIVNLAKSQIFINSIKVSGCGIKVYEAFPLEIGSLESSEFIDFSCVIDESFSGDILIDYYSELDSEIRSAEGFIK